MSNPVEKALDAPVVKIVTAHPLVSVGLGIALIFVALLLDALVAAFSPSRRGLFERIRSGVDWTVRGAQAAASPPATQSAATAGRG